MILPGLTAHVNLTRIIVNSDVVVDAGGSRHYSGAIPNISAFVGFEFVAQAVFTAPAPRILEATDGIPVTVVS